MLSGLVSWNTTGTKLSKAQSPLRGPQTLLGGSGHKAQRLFLELATQLPGINM